MKPQLPLASTWVDQFAEWFLAGSLLLFAGVVIWSAFLA